MNKKLKLILPSKKYAASYLKAIKEFKENDSRVAAVGIDKKFFTSVKDFSLYNKKLIDNRKGINLPKGRVASTLYWAVIRNKFIGRVDLRHRLNKGLKTYGGHIGYVVAPSERRKGYATEMLRLGLLKAREIGIKKVLVTCDEDNIASRKVIEKNNGVFAGKIKNEEGWKLRFWINNK